MFFFYVTTAAMKRNVEVGVPTLESETSFFCWGCKSAYTRH